jgi:hypothetical protein
MTLTPEQWKRILANHIFGRRLLDGIDSPPSPQQQRCEYCGRFEHSGKCGTPSPTIAYLNATRIP